MEWSQFGSGKGRYVEAVSEEQRRAVLDSFDVELPRRGGGGSANKKKKKNGKK
jgi:hypothetical protein